MERQAVLYTASLLLLSPACVSAQGASDLKGVRVLNNLVWELLELDGEIQGDQTFTNPTRRWVFIRTTAEVSTGASLRICLDGDAPAQPVLVHTDTGPKTLEAMRFLPEGEHRLRILTEGEARLTHLTVRSIPMLQHAFYGANPHISAHGPYTWEFLARDVLPNVNVMIGPPGPETEEWKRSGRKWITIIGVPKVTETGEAAVEQAYQHWAGAEGLTHPLLDGIIVDEFGGGDDAAYDVYRRAVERIYAEPRFAGRMFLPYGYGDFFSSDDRGFQFAGAAVEGGGYLCWERYLREEPDEGAAREVIRRSIVDPVIAWQEHSPDAASKVCMVLGYMSQPNESLNVDPTVDFRVYMDMQMHVLATHPALFGLGGVQWYHSSYCDEENVRLAGRLFRHYCIEGNTEPLIRDPYKLTHLRNPDFAEGTDAWEVSPAEEGAIETSQFSGYSWLEGRYPRTEQGDTFLLVTRSASGPNTFSQTIGSLEPGRLYSLKMISADYDDLVNERSNKAESALSITINNVEAQPGPKQSFQFTVPSCYAHILGAFNAQHPFYMNYHWRVFRAKGTEARLTVSDWASTTDPDGPIGQRLVLNFIEVQPYLGD